MESEPDYAESLIVHFRRIETLKEDALEYPFLSLNKRQLCDLALLLNRAFYALRGYRTVRSTNPPWKPCASPTELSGPCRCAWISWRTKPTPYSKDSPSPSVMKRAFFLPCFMYPTSGRPTSS